MGRNGGGTSEGSPVVGTDRSENILQAAGKASAASLDICIMAARTCSTRRFR